MRRVPACTPCGGESVLPPSSNQVPPPSKSSPGRFRHTLNEKTEPSVWGASAFYSRKFTVELLASKGVFVGGPKVGTGSQVGGTFAAVGLASGLWAARSCRLVRAVYRTKWYSANGRSLARSGCRAARL